MLALFDFLKFAVIFIYASVTLNTISVACIKLKHNDVKNHIFEWWQKSSIQTPIKCVETNDAFRLKNKLIYYLPKPRIRAFTCNNGTPPTRYLFTGLNKSHSPDGKGKVKAISNSEWLSWSESEQSNFTKLNICYDLIDSNETPIIEIIGTFKNSLLHGTAKIKWSDNLTSILKFRNGYPNGFQRVWDSKGRLLKAQKNSKGNKIGGQWHLMLDHLIYTNASFINNEEERLSVVIPLLEDGTFGDPLVGSFRPHLNMLENVHHVELTNVSSKESACLMEIEYKKLEKQEYRYILRNKSKLPLSMHETTPLCSINSSDISEVPGRRIQNILNSVDQLIYGENNLVNHNFYEGYKVLWRLKPITEDINESRSLKLISNITFDHKRKNVTAVILGSAPLRITFNELHMNVSQELNGYCDISVAQDDRRYLPRDKALQWPPYRIRGMFNHGKLNGIVTIETNTISSGWALVRKGVMHGPVVFHGLMPVIPSQLDSIYGQIDVNGMQVTNVILRKGTRFLGYYKNGHAHGTFWVGLIGAYPYPHLHGKISTLDGCITGNNIAYIYGDMETSFVGKFENRVMIEAKYSKVTQMACDDNGIPYVDIFSEEPSATFYHEPPSNISFGAGPSGVQDPLENKMVDLRMSGIPNSGQGVFLKEDAKKGTVVSLYDGYVYTSEQLQIYKKNCHYNISKSDDERRRCSKYAIRIADLNVQINIPPEIDTTETFFPTLGQKVNHNFVLNNTHFEPIDHPRWGIIQSVVTNRDLKAGEELFGHYGYKKVAFPLDRPWYHELERKIQKERRMESKNQNIKRK